MKNAIKKLGCLLGLFLIASMNNGLMSHGESGLYIANKVYNLPLWIEKLKAEMVKDVLNTLTAETEGASAASVRKDLKTSTPFKIASNKFELLN
jgi:hypothetical protein